MWFLDKKGLHESTYSLREHNVSLTERYFPCWMIGWVDEGILTGLPGQKLLAKLYTN